MLCLSTRRSVAELGDPLQERSRPQTFQPWGCGLRGGCGHHPNFLRPVRARVCTSSPPCGKGQPPPRTMWDRGCMFAVLPGEGGGGAAEAWLADQAAGESVSGRGADHGLRAAGRPGAEPASVGGRLAAQDGTRRLWAPGWTGRRWACVLCRQSHSSVCRSLGACVWDSLGRSLGACVWEEPASGPVPHQGGAARTEVRVCLPALPLTGCVTLGELLPLSGPQFPRETST